MGNLSFIVPTQKLEDFNIDKVCDILGSNLPKISFKMSKEFKQVICEKDGHLVTELYFEQDCYVLQEDNLEEDKEYLKEIGKEELIDDLVNLINVIKPDLNNVIQMTFGSPYVYEERFEITDTLRQYFKSYTFDEGIHPEFMSPDYKRTQSSVDFFQKLKNLFL